MIYLDYAASSPPYAEVCARVAETMETIYANPAAIHSAAAPARRILRESRRTMAELLGFRDSSVIFTSGGTEGNNTAVRGAARLTERKKLLLGAAEHSSVLQPALALRREGYAVELVKPDENGRIRPEDIAEKLTRDTALVSVQAANNETGTLQDIEGIAALAHGVGALYHCDAVQSFGHTELPLSCADLVTLSAHKFGGPRGVGVLALREGLMLPPLICGGGQELGLRSGTENIAGIAGMALAAELACGECRAEEMRLRALSELFVALLRREKPDIVLHSGNAARLAGILSLRIPGVSAEALLVKLDRRGICLSAGSACAARDPSPSHVLLSMGLSPQEAGETVRVSIGRLTTEQELRTAAKAIAERL